MQIVQTTFQIGLISNEVFPEAALPNAAFTLFATRFTHGRLVATLTEILLSEPRLDGGPSPRKISVSFWQSPNAVHVVRQDNYRIDLKVPKNFHFIQCLVKCLSTDFGREDWLSGSCYGGKEKRPASNPPTTIVCHSDSFVRWEAF